MRRTLTLLAEIRKAQLEASGKPESRIKEAMDMFAFIDKSLNNVAPSGGGFDGPESMLGEAMTSADFQYAIGEFVRRRMVPGYQMLQFQFEPLVKQVENVNFLLHTDYQDRTTGAGDLLPIGLEKHEAQSDSRADAVKRAYRPYRWQRQIDFSMEILVNDELGYFNDQAQRFGQAARRTLERYVTNMMTNATTLARLAGLGAMYTTTGRLTSDRISVAEMAFSRRTDSLGNPISVSPKYLVHHKSLANVVRTIRASQLVPETATNAANIVANDLTYISNPHLQAGAGINDLPWMVLADANGAENVIPFVLVRRQGVPGPIVFRKRSDMEMIGSLMGGGTPAAPQWGDFANGDVVLKIYDEWGTYIDDTEGNLYDYRGMYYSSGTAA